MEDVDVEEEDAMACSCWAATTAVVLYHTRGTAARRNTDDAVVAISLEVLDANMVECECG